MRASISAKDWADKHVTKGWVLEKITPIVFSMVDAVRYGLKGDRYEVIVFTVASGSWGSNQWRAVCDFFDWEGDKDAVPDEEVQYIWDDLDKFAGYVASKATEYLQGTGLNGVFYFGHNEADGAYEFYYGETYDLGGPSDAVVEYLAQFDYELRNEYIGAEIF